MKTAMQEKEKRGIGSRNPTEAVVVCRPFSSSGNAPTADCVMHNFSDGGAYIETSCEFKLGTIIHLRMVRYPSIQLFPRVEEQPRAFCLAEVKWRLEMVDGETLQYGFGLRYLDYT